MKSYSSPLWQGNSHQKSTESHRGQTPNRKYKIVSKLSTEKLTRLYTNSIGLLIPLDPNSLQDKYRFSQKIAEYLATKTPIITCNVGEISHYLRNKESCIFAEYTIESYANAMKWVVENPEESKK